MALRSLKLVANCLIKLANYSEAKDTQLDSVLTPFKQKYQQRLVQFLDELSVRSYNCQDFKLHEHVRQDACMYMHMQAR